MPVRTLEQVEERVAALEAELAQEKRASKRANDLRRVARRKVRLEVSAKVQRKIGELQRAAATRERPSSWHDGAVAALEAHHREVALIADDGPDEEG